MNPEGNKECWLCKAPASGETTAEPRGGQHATFRLSSLMLTVTLIAVCLGIWQLSSGLGIFFAIIVAPAFVRTAITAVRQRRLGEPMEIEDKIITFVASIGVVVSVAVASGIAFLVTCWTACAGVVAVSESTGIRTGAGIWASILAGTVAALIVAVLLFRATWPRDRSRKKRQP